MEQDKREKQSLKGKKLIMDKDNIEKKQEIEQLKESQKSNNRIFDLHLNEIIKLKEQIRKIKTQNNINIFLICIVILIIQIVNIFT